MNQSVNASRRAFLRGRLASATPPPRLAEINAECLARQNIVCRSCGDQCEAGAIRFRPRLGGAALPEVNAETCTACGDCLSSCPSQAIALTGDSVAPSLHALKEPA